MVRRYELSPTPAFERPPTERSTAGLAQGPLSARSLRAPSLAQTSLAWVTGILATTAACLVGAVLVVVFAATLAVVLVLASALVASAALAWRLRRPARRAARMIEERKVGHSWIAYGWDQQP